MAYHIVESYVHPITKKPLYRGGDDLFFDERCQIVAFRSHGGVFDFVSAEQDQSQERDYYDTFYKKSTTYHMTDDFFKHAWNAEAGFNELLDSMGSLEGKKILLLGNGISLKEFLFLQRGAQVVYTDLSIAAVNEAKAIFDKSEVVCATKQTPPIEFHAVDACHLPFPDNSFDIIYGCVFVHHISELDILFKDIHRCLVPGGTCCFMDPAYSPLWQTLKSLLRPLQVYSHKKHGISPADLITTKRGGYKYEDVLELKELVGFKDMSYTKYAFFQYILHRGTLKLGFHFLRRLNGLMRFVDMCGDKMCSLIRNHGIVLVWGYRK